MPNPLIGYERRAYIRQTWEDEWAEEPYLVPLVCSKVCAPGMDSATLVYSAGTIKREDSTVYLPYDPGNVRDWYVAIQTSQEGSGVWNTVFVGVITDQDYGTEGVVDYQGLTTIHCLGMQYILDRTMVKHAFAIGTTGPERIEWVPGFNERFERSHKIRGNRTEEAVGGIHYFHAEEKSIWTNK